jgi:hypothetical protein
MLAASRRGQSLSTTMARDFSFEMLQGLVRAGLATAHRDGRGAMALAELEAKRPLPISGDGHA